MDNVETLSTTEIRTLAAAVERLFPSDELGPGALELGVPNYIGGYLARHPEQVQNIRAGLAAVEADARWRYRASFHELEPSHQDAVLAAVESADSKGVFALLLDMTRQGLFSDPAYGGNRDRLGWRFLGIPDFEDPIAHSEGAR